MTNTPFHFSNRESLMQANSALIADLQDRLKAKRYRSQDVDSSKLGHINALVQALHVQNEILASTELDEIKEEIEKMKRL